jgi:AAA domain, putative AbiEii toxin, Type IV TA system
MYLRNLKIQHMKRIADLSLDFEHEGQPRMWTVLIGENGTAKTTILQSIALAAAGGRQVNTLGKPIVKHLRDRRGDSEMTVAANFAFTALSLADPVVHPHAHGTEGLGLYSEIGLEKDSTSMAARSEYTTYGERTLATVASPREHYRDVLDDARGAHTRLWFVAGYGISRNLPDSTFTPALDLPSIDRMQPLFDARAALASSSFANHFLKKDALEGKAPGSTSLLYARRLNEAIKLGGFDLLPDILKLELRGQGGAKTAAALIDSDRFYQRMGSTELAVAGVALSHGYQSTLAWIADLIGHVLLEAKSDHSTTEMEGLVLIDEIDLYLHPAWQATFITALRRVFPRMQFVVTTHSPVVLAEMAPHEIVRLIVDEQTGDVVRGGWDLETGEIIPVQTPDPAQPDPRPMTASEIYRTWFGIDRLTPNPLGEELRRYRVLADDPIPSASDKLERAHLRAQLLQGGIEDPDDGAS